MLRRMPPAVAVQKERNGHAGRIRAHRSNDENVWRGEAGDWRATVREGGGVRAPIAGRSVDDMRFGM